MSRWRRRARGGSTPAPAAPGVALDRGFFDDRPRFFETSHTSTQPWRLNLRHEAIFAANADAFADARVLDIASHDGRWSLAAALAGASHVTGVEARPELVASARENLTAYGVAGERFDFLTGDVFEVLHREPLQVDVVLCLGFFYHTLRYPEMWSLMARTGAPVIIMDTMVTPGVAEPMIRVTHEPFTREGNAVPDPFASDELVLTGRPTVSALRVMASVYGYAVAGRTDWAALLAANPAADGVGDYREGRRATIRFERDTD